MKPLAPGLGCDAADALVGLVNARQSCIDQRRGGRGARVRAKYRWRTYRGERAAMRCHALWTCRQLRRKARRRARGAARKGRGRCGPGARGPPSVGQEACRRRESWPRPSSATVGYCDPADRISVKAEHGILTLSGMVDWHYQRVETEYDLRKLSGVRGVEIEVAPKPRAGGRARQDTRRARPSRRCPGAADRRRCLRRPRRGERLGGTRRGPRRRLVRAWSNRGGGQDRASSGPAGVSRCLDPADESSRVAVAIVFQSYGFAQASCLS